MFKLATAPQNPDQVIQNAWFLFIHSWRSVAAWAFLLALISILPNVLIPELNASDYPTKIQGTKIFSDYLLLYFMLLIFFQNSLILRLHQFMHQQSKPLAYTLTHAFYKMLPLFLASVLFAVVVGLGLMAFVLPGLFFALRLVFYTPLILLHEQGVLSSLQASFQLTQNQSWRTLQVMLMPIAVFFISSLLLTLFSNLLIQLGLTADSQSFNTLILWAQFGLTALISPLFYAFILVQLHDLQLRAGLKPKNNSNENNDKELIA
jgi:hypothetical protein